MADTYEIVALILCFIGSGFFSCSEAVLLSVGIDRTRQLIEEGGSRGKAMFFMAERPNEILTTILIGNNVVNIAAASLTTTIAARIFQNDVVAISTGITTIIILIVGEIIPKTFGRSHAEKLVFPIIRILQVNYYILYPLTMVLTWIPRTILGEYAQVRGRMVTKDDIEYMVNKAEKDKTIDSKQIDLLTSILEFPTIKVKDIMIPRSEVRFIRMDLPFGEIIDYIMVDTHSRYPVCDLDLDNTVGFLHVKDLAFVRGQERQHFRIQKLLKAPFFVYEHMKIQPVFDHMNRKKVHLALVKDENGLVVGIITLEDIVEEIFGEIHDEHDVDESAEGDQQGKDKREEGIIVDPKMSIRDLYNEFDIKIPLNDNYSTITGFLLDMLGNNFPEKGQIIVWEGYSFELMEVVDNEVYEVRITDVDGEHIFSKRDAQEADLRSENSDKNEEDKEDSNGSE